MIKKLLAFILLQCVISVAFATNYLTFTAEEAGSKFGIYNSEDNDPDVQYSLDDGVTWTVLSPGDRIELKNVGDKALLRGNNVDGFSLVYKGQFFYTSFVMTGKIAASGSVMSLIDNTGTSKTLSVAGCFYQLFSNCSALTKAPELPATTLSSQCYQMMFYNCTNLKEAPELPATTLMPGCYASMFYFCESLEKAPYLPATKFFKDYGGHNEDFIGCYTSMFGKCKSLKEIKVNISDWGEIYEVKEGVFDSNTSGWVTDVATKGGVFVCPESLPLEYGEDRIPRAWTVKSREEEIANYLTFTAEEGIARFSISNSSDHNPNLQYSTDGKTWIDLEEGESVLIKGNQAKVMLRGTNPEGFSLADSKYTKFVMTGKIAASGSVMSLIDGLGETTVIPNNFCFAHLFEDCISLTQAPELPAPELTKGCYDRMFVGCVNLVQTPELPATTMAEYCYYGMFQGCRGIVKTPALPAKKLADFCYAFMFGDCRSLTNTPELPAMELAKYCYGFMFSDCSELAQAPELPATELMEGCYEGMFDGCEKLSQIKVDFTEWNATSTGGWVSGVAPTGNFICSKALPLEYSNNRIPEGWRVIFTEDGFANSLTFTAEEDNSTFGIENHGENNPDIQYSLDGGKTWIDLKAESTITLKSKGDKALIRGTNPEGFSKTYYQYTRFVMTGKIAASGSVMSLIDGLGETTVIPNGYCFTHLFEFCTCLTHAPELPSQKLTNNCYEYMFSDCTSLVEAPALPARTLAAECYEGMFVRCSKIRTAPELPATTLADHCYYDMFAGCDGIINAPALPATTLADHCYEKMFSGCTFTKAPALPATTLADGCYDGMFIGCENLSQIKVNFTEWNETSTSGWVYGVAPTGYFICPKTLAEEIGTDRIPKGWVLKHHINYLTFTAEEDNSTFGIEVHSENAPDIQYSLDGGETWTDLIAETAITLKSKGDRALLRGTNPEGFSKEYQYTKFVMTGKIAASGSVMSLIDGTGETTAIPNGYCFTHLFEFCTGLTQAPELPSKKLTNNCYEYMFSDCTNLVEAPALPAKTLAAECYEGMFIRCSKIRTAPELPATTLADYCYYDMFAGCDGIINAPALPATTLADHCYEKMFSGCTFTKAPALPATTLADGCYDGMFIGCENLNQIKVNFTEWNATSTSEWVYGVAPAGYFICSKTLAEEIGTDRIPKGWRVIYIEEIGDCVDPSSYTTAYSGGKSYTDNGVLEVIDNGYTAEIGTFTHASPLGNVTVFGGNADCAFKASWESNTIEDYMVGVGYHDGNASKKYADLGEVYAVYNYTKSGTAGVYSYIGVHGWMKNPLIEYFIVDDSYNSNGGAMFYATPTIGKYTVDGVEYKLLFGRLVGPTIEGYSDYQHIFAVRSSYQTCGEIKVSEHFRNWEDLGIEMGNIYDCKIHCNVSGGTGSIEYTCASMSWNGKESSLGDLNCGKISYSDPTDMIDAVSSETTVWTEGNTIYVRDSEGDVEVYDMLGRLIASKRNGQENIQIPVPQKGIYVVKVGTETHKVVL